MCYTAKCVNLFFFFPETFQRVLVRVRCMLCNTRAGLASDSRCIIEIARGYLFFSSARKSSETERLKYRLTVHDNAPVAADSGRGRGRRGRGGGGGGGDCFYRGRERVFVSARAVC